MFILPSKTGGGTLCALAVGVENIPPSIAAPTKSLSLEACRNRDPYFLALVAATAQRYQVEPSALGVRTLLHLPRVAAGNGMLTRGQVDAELRNSAAGLRADQAKIAALIPTAGCPLGDLLFVRYDDRFAAAIFEHLHYLRSARAGAVNYALVNPLNGLPVTLCSVSPLEWKVVGRQLQNQFDVPVERACDVSRVFSFDVAPRNAISRLLAKVRNVLRRDSEVELLTTAVDPNLGFTGLSYRAANWQHWMSIAPRPYLYLDGRYVSPRRLLEEFDTANLAKIRTLHGIEVEQSQVRLLDSAIFCWRTRGGTEIPPPATLRRLRRR